jgi:cytochrome c oxidase assembly protein subunit 15
MSQAEAVQTLKQSSRKLRRSVYVKRRPVGWWLLAMCGVLLLMILVGGATRLTDSGLSITEWRPVTGAIPPLSTEQWKAELEKYRQIPEYKFVNKGMTLSEFKFIYYWEWGHRLLGRLIGLLFAGGFVWFWWRGALDKKLTWKLGGIFILGGLQGAMGWYMVMSGLTERIDVSQYRLTAHLGLAFVLLAAMLWVAMDLLFERDGKGDKRLRHGAFAITGLVFVQVLLGGFVAGLKAGYIYNSWPLMEGRVIPQGLWTHSPAIISIFESQLTAQFFHRMTAYVLAIGVGVFVWWALRQPLNTEALRAVIVLGAATGAQILLGIWTLVAAVPISLGIAHQVGAALVFAASLHAAWRFMPGKV